MTLDRPPPSIEARSLSKSFAGQVANADVDFCAHPGEVHAVLGENGAGKSTLVAMLSGLYRPDGGEILVRGRKVDFRSPADALGAGIGVVWQEFRLVENLTVLENVLLGTGQRPSSVSRARVAQAAERAGFRVPLAAPIRTLAVAQRQQVEILRLLFRELDILIFDEPTAVLGETQVSELFTALAALREEGKTIIIITHRLREVRMVADRLTVLRAGAVKARDRMPDELTDAGLAELMVGAGASPATPRSPATPGVTVLRMTGVHVRATNGSGLGGIGLELRTGEIVGVAGVRGNGQREIAELAAGILRPDAGVVERDQEPVGFIPEDRLGTGLSRGMTVAENLALRRYRERPISRPWRIDRAALRRFAEHQIELYAIPSRAEHPVTRLSGGGLQRVVVARELERGVRLLVAAQPTRGLDLRSAEFVRTQLAATARSGAGVLLVSEDLDELMELSDRLVVLYDGAIVATVPRTEFDRRRLGEIMLRADAA